MLCDPILYRLLALVVIIPSALVAVAVISAVVISAIKPKPSQ